LIPALHTAVAKSVVAWGATGAIDESHRDVTSFFYNTTDDKSEESAENRGYLINAYGEEKPGHDPQFRSGHQGSD
jgi:hypothetical protein